ncbi:MAG: HEAT repeat domain-containing protein [Planctomycetaceae bacterium]|nr:HEAT repeat domain-containing protein [Planctomycetaceae bacterium]
MRFALAWALMGWSFLAIHDAVVLADDPASSRDRINPDVAGNEEVERILRTFPGRGAVGDDSSPTPAAEAVTQFELPEDLQIELVAAEPVVEQPLFMHFDHRGRMWVVQYRQYPFPAGLKVIHYDQHLRAVFDKVPEPPPHGVKGKDKITVFEDTNGDGKYDTHRDVIEGLNITSAVIAGHGGIWVLNPPYLLFYPDANDDAIPDGDPVVKLSGFGLEDTHSVTNSMRWGPDGWIYAANGSTTTGNVSSAVNKNVQYEGQCIWRYHPDTEIFEIYAEGGGNTFSTEFDIEGRVFSGTNHGNTRGMFYPQGSYGTKNWGKHGPLTNPFAFGYFQHMPHKGDTDRFAQTFAIYEGGLLPERYNHTVIAANALHNRVWASQLMHEGSTYRTEDMPPVVTTPDQWFRPVDLKVGPEGAVYLADWYDTRLTHVDPRDNWHKTSGRIYRILPKAKSDGDSANHDLTRLTDAELITALSAPNKWRRHAAVRVLAERNFGKKHLGYTQLVQQMQDIISSPDGKGPVLEAVWVLNLLHVLDDRQLESLLSHQTADVRRWALRLIGDRRSATPQMISTMGHMAATEKSVDVLSQLASTIKRLPAPQAVQVLPPLVQRDDLMTDPHIPLLVWWAVEAQCAANPAQASQQLAVAIPEAARSQESPRHDLLTMWEADPLWRSTLSQQILLKRLMQRFALESLVAEEHGEDAASKQQRQDSLMACARLLELAPTPEDSELLMQGFLEAYEGHSITDLPEQLAQPIKQYRESIGNSDLILSMKLGDEKAVQEALAVIKQNSANPAQRVAYMKVLGELKRKESVPTLLGLLSSPSPGIQRTALATLMNFDDPGIGATICSRWQSTITEEHNLRGIALQVLASRPEWTKQLLKEIQEFRIKSNAIPLDIVQQMRLHQDESIQALLNEYWGKTRSTPEEKRQQIARIAELLKSSQQPTPDPVIGQQVFKKHCGVCHTLFNEGGQTGPNLTGYERTNLDFMLLAMVDPSAAIREEFTQYQIAMNDGRILTGLIVDQTSAVVSLRGANNEVTTVNKSEIEVLQAMPTSIMPDGLMQKLTDEEVRHLFSFLVRRTPPVAGGSAGE